MAGLLAVPLGASAFELLSSPRASLASHEFTTHARPKNWSCGRPGTVLLEKWLILPFSTTLKKKRVRSMDGKERCAPFFFIRRIGKNMG